MTALSQSTRRKLGVAWATPRTSPPRRLSTAERVYLSGSMYDHDRPGCREDASLTQSTIGATLDRGSIEEQLRRKT
jgi:hypothetical protein